MQGSSPGRAADPEAVLADLLHLVAQAPESTHGKPNWESLVALVSSPSAGDASSEPAGVPELIALQRKPSDWSLAQDLARAITARARIDPQFRRALSNWRRRKAIQALTAGIVSRRTADTGGKPAPAQKPWYRRKPVWVGALAVPVLGGLITGVILAFVTPFGEKVVDGPSVSSVPAAASSSGPSSPTAEVPGAYPPPSARTTVPGTASNSPAKVEAVTPLNTEPDENWALPDKVQLTSAQLAEAGASDATVASYLSSIHAVPLGGGFTNVTVVGNEKAAVTITGIQVVKDCQAPLSGTLFLSPSQGVNLTVAVGFNLDSPIDYAQNSSVSGISGNYFEGHNVTLSPGETETFDIHVETVKHYCTFTFQMTVATANGPVTEDISNNGNPFELTAGVAAANSETPYSGYAALYFGGVEAMGTPALRDPSGDFVQVNPKTFHGG